MSWPVTIPPYLGMGAALLGLIGSGIILYATWGTIGLRRSIVLANEVRVTDRTVAAAILILKGELTQIQLDELKFEHRCYQVGMGFLAAGFLLALVREFL
ncbi:MAG: hypothetical protein JSR72_04035 [Proteobacteria bacterium]|nr:hypothetical protein [Pseudomonadota bacterium]